MSTAANIVSPAELKGMLDEGGCCLVDVREPMEYAQEHIDSARSIPLGRLARDAGELDPHRPVVVMCLGGKRGEQARVQLQASGFSDVRNLEGGLLAWQEAGLPVHRGSTGVLPLMRQVQLVVGTATFAGAVLALAVHPLFAVIPALSGAGLIINGASGWCGLAIFLSKMPWNRVGRNPSGAWPAS